MIVKKIISKKSRKIIKLRIEIKESKNIINYRNKRKRTHQNHNRPCQDKTTFRGQNPTNAELRPRKAKTEIQISNLSPRRQNPSRNGNSPQRHPFHYQRRRHRRIFNRHQPQILYGRRADFRIRPHRQSRPQRDALQTPKTQKAPGSEPQTQQPQKLSRNREVRKSGSSSIEYFAQSSRLL